MPLITEPVVLSMDSKNLPTGDHCVDLIVTSPPYPMVEMWDALFASADKIVERHLTLGAETLAFNAMHEVLFPIWQECTRVLKPGGIVCINIGDATRTLWKNFRFYPNHTKVIEAFNYLGLQSLPDILWHKPTNAPNKFMGSGMLPVNAYVTYEHEYILVFRKNPMRVFKTEAEKLLRRQSAFFWEERNVWFSDIWSDIPGASQTSTTPQRTAAFPFDLPYRLISMFSVQGDLVLDPFAGTGTTLAAAETANRRSIGVEINPDFIPIIESTLKESRRNAFTYIQKRLEAHRVWARQRIEEKGPLKHYNSLYDFPVMTKTESFIDLKGF